MTACFCRLAIKTPMLLLLEISLTDCLSLGESGWKHNIIHACVPSHFHYKHLWHQARTWTTLVIKEATGDKQIFVAISPREKYQMIMLDLTVGGLHSKPVILSFWTVFSLLLHSEQVNTEAFTATANLQHIFSSQQMLKENIQDYINAEYNRLVHLQR